MIHHGVGRSRCARVWRRATLVLTASAVFSAAHELRAAPATDERVDSATRAVNELKLSLKNELEQAMAAGGPDNAIGICRERAPALARDIGQKHGVAVGRSSHKLRNANNAPRPWVKAVLDEWLKVSATERKPRVVPVSNDVVGYVEPIGTQGLCLTCHGEQVAESIRVKLRASYSRDLAIGFKEGELRGALWAEARTKESK